MTDSQPATTEPSRRIPAWVPWAGGAFGGFLIGVIATFSVITFGGSVTQAAVDTRLTSAEAKCGDGAGVTVEDEGKTLVYEMKGEDDLTGAEYSAFECIAEELAMPSSVTSHVGQTTAQDGRQVEQWDGIEFSWSYHPDRGLDGVFVLVDRTDH